MCVFLPIYKNKDSDSLDRYCEDECKAIEKWFGIDIKVISFHKPSKYLLSLNKKNIAGRINTYHSTYFKKIIYCSDSRGDWHYGSPLNNLNGKNNKALQLLTHPIWWDIQSEMSPEKNLEHFVLKKIKLFCNNLTACTEVFKEEKLLNHLKKLD